jgi:signal transduction histidine kinase
VVTHPLSSRPTSDFLCVTNARWQEMQRESLENRSLNERLSLALLALGHGVRQNLQLLDAGFPASVPSRGGRQRADRTIALISRLSRKCDQAAAIAATVRADTKVISPVPIQAVLLDAYQQWHPEAERKGLQFKLSSPNVLVPTNAFWLDVIVSNLIGNAIEHTASGGVTVDLSGGNHQWVLTVLDSAAAAAPRVPTNSSGLEAYRSRKGNHGSGIGLKLVKRAAALLEHPLTISRSPSGCVIRLHIARGARPVALLPRRTVGDVV